MELFDIEIKKEIKTKKSREDILNSIEKRIKKFSKDMPKLENNTLVLNNLKTSILKYDLKINLEKSPRGFNISINGELQQFFVLILTGLIILSIILTLGIGIVFIIPFAFLQKHYATKSINSSIEYIS